MRFIYTNDISVKNTLLSFGFKLLKSNNDKIWVFENNDKILLENPMFSNFSIANKEKIVLSDILTF